MATVRRLMAYWAVVFVMAVIVLATVDFFRSGKRYAHVGGEYTSGQKNVTYIKDRFGRISTNRILRPMKPGEPFDGFKRLREEDDRVADWERQYVFDPAWWEDTILIDTVTFPMQAGKHGRVYAYLGAAILIFSVTAAALRPHKQSS